MRLPCLATTLAVVVAVVSHSAGAQDKTADRDPRWAAIGRVFGQKGHAEDGYFRVELPRTDQTVHMGADVLEMPFDLTSFVGFVPIGKRDVLAMGELVLREDEVPAVMDELHRQGISTPALHNHLLGESPRIMFIHVMARGEAESIATKLRAAFAKSATPQTAPADTPAQSTWSAVDAILGKHTEAKGHTAEYEFPRGEHLTVDGVAVKSSGTIESGSEVVFQQFADGHAACTGEMFVLPREIDPVARVLGAHGFHVTAVHNHMIVQTPQMYWLHWYGTGDAATLARGVAAALAETNGARKSGG